MESRIEELIDKYWKGDTSLSEESEIKEYFRSNPMMSPEGLYFRGLSHEQEVKKKFKHPSRRQTYTWWSAAASVIVGIGVAFLVLQDARDHQQFVVDDPEEAYEITRKALMMVGSSLHEGKSYSAELNKINEAEEKLTKDK